MITPITPGDPSTLAARVAAARETLLAALHGVTEREFSAEVAPGETVLAALLHLARTEREAVQAGRAALGAPPRPAPTSEADPARVLPPQAVHDLAGAWYETDLLLEAATQTPDTAARIVPLLEPIIAQAEGLAARIVARRADAAGQA